MKKIIILIILIFAFQLKLRPQDDFQTLNLQTNNEFGIFIGGNYNIHDATFSKLIGIPSCCPRYESGTGTGFNAGLLYNYKLDNYFALGARLGIISLNGTLTKQEKTTLIQNNGAVDGVFEHRINGKLLNISLNPEIIFYPIKNLYLSLGTRLGLNLTKTYDQLEAIVSPAGIGSFKDTLGNDTHSRTRNYFAGDIPEAKSFQMFVTAGAGYELPINKNGNLRLVPELHFYYNMTDIAANTDWRANSILIGIAFKYSPLPEAPKIPKNEIFKEKKIIDTINIQTDILTESEFRTGSNRIAKETNESETEIITTQTTFKTDTLITRIKYKLDGNITAVGLDSNGTEIPNPIFHIEEFVSNRLDPLLNYIFYENNSYEIPSRYKLFKKNETHKFDLIENLYDSTLNIYNNILNIIASRLKEFPEANIALTGCNSNSGDEKANLDLSQKRAEKISDYFVNIWGIDKNRIKIEKRNLPQKPSTPTDEPDKIEENRRVEIYSDNYEILKPVFIEKIDRKSNPPVIRFKSESVSEAGLKNWSIAANQNSDKINQFTYSENSSNIKSVDWELESFQKIIPKSPEPVMFSLSLTDLKGNNKIIENKTQPIDIISIKKKRSDRKDDYEIERFSLILFDFDKANIDGINKNIIDFISERIKPESQIEISGYTDRTGKDDYNLKLSERRADETKSKLKRTDAISKGIGKEKILYNNDLPEGRFYCRTVEIIVKTKIK